MQIKRLDADFQLKAISEDGGFSGYGSVFGVEDYYGEIVDQGAFQDSLDEHRGKGTMPALLWQHDAHEPIGVWTEMREDDTGLYVEGRLLVDEDPVARRAHAHLKAKSVSGLSIGFMVRDFAVVDEVMHLTKIDLWETSIVTFPANPAARVSVVKQFAAGETPDIRSLERALRDVMGMSREQSKAFLAEGYRGLSSPRDAASGELDALNSLSARLRALNS